MPSAIINDRIDSLRITIYDVFHYLEGGFSPEEITAILPLTPEQVQAALHYIAEHRDEVMAVHQRIEARIAAGNPPEIEAHARVGRARMDALRRNAAMANNINEVNGEGVVGGRQ